MTITAVDLFGNSIVTSKHKIKVEAANKISQDIFNKRYEPPYKKVFSAYVTLKNIELAVIEVIKGHFHE